MSPIQWNPAALFYSRIFPKIAQSKAAALRSSCQDPCLGFFSSCKGKEKIKLQEPTCECSGHPPSTTSTYRFRYRPTLKKKESDFESTSSRASYRETMLDRGSSVSTGKVGRVVLIVLLYFFCFQQKMIITTRKKPWGGGGKKGR